MMKLKVRTKPSTISNDKTKGYAMVTLGSSLTIYPIRIIEGTNGLFIAFPQRAVGGLFKDICYPKTRAFRDEITNAVISTYTAAPETENEAVYDGYVHPDVVANVTLYRKEHSNIVAMASLVVGDVVKIDSVSLYKNRDGALDTYYPKRAWTANGHQKQSDIIFPTDSYRIVIDDAIKQAYNVAVESEKQSTWHATTDTPFTTKENKFNTFHQREYTSNDWKALEAAMLQRSMEVEQE